MYQRAGPYVAGWGHELDTQYEIWEGENRSSSVPAKRAGSGQDDLAVRGKRSKIAPRDQGIDDAGMKDLFNANDINKVGEIIHATRPAFQPILGGSLTTVLRHTAHCNGPERLANGQRHGYQREEDRSGRSRRGIF